MLQALEGIQEVESNWFEYIGCLWNKEFDAAIDFVKFNVDLGGEPLLLNFVWLVEFPLTKIMNEI